MFRGSEVVPGVYRVVMARRALGRALYPASWYAVPGSGVMVDSGSARFAARTARAARAARISAVLLTHAHEDHSGGAEAVRRETGAPVFAHRAAVPTLAEPGRLGMRAYRRFLFGTPVPVAARPVPEEFEARGLRLRVVAAPGHSPDQVAFLEERRGWLFVGDAYIPSRDNVFFGRGCDLGAWIGTLRALADLGARVMFTGLGVVSRRPGRVLREKADRFEEIAARVREMRSRGLGERRIAREAFPRDVAVRVVTGGDFSSLNFVRACLR